MKILSKTELWVLGIGAVIVILLIPPIIRGFHAVPDEVASSSTPTPTASPILSNQPIITQSPTKTMETPVKITGKNISTDPHIQIIEVKAGTGAVAKAGSHVYVHYTGTFTNGKKFDSSYDRGQPIDFQLGAGQVIQGWDIGIQGMKVGEKRHLIISPEYGYGKDDYHSIPGNSTLLFDVELVDVK